MIGAILPGQIHRRDLQVVQAGERLADGAFEMHVIVDVMVGVFVGVRVIDAGVREQSQRRGSGGGLRPDRGALGRRALPQPAQADQDGVGRCGARPEGRRSSPGVCGLAEEGETCLECWEISSFTWIGRR